MAQGGATQLIFTVERIAVKLGQTKLNVHKTTFSKLIREPAIVAQAVIREKNFQEIVAAPKPFSISPSRDVN